MTKYYCPMPWHGGFFTPTHQAVCCTHAGAQGESPLTYIKSDHVKQIKQNLISGNLDEDCALCQKKEQQGLISLKEVFEKTLINHGVDFCQDPAVDSRPASIEVRFGNLCNFQCRMCGPRYSNLIGKEIDLNPGLKRFFNEDNPGLKMANDHFFNEIVQLLPELKQIYFTGGEPMIHKQVLQLMAVMIEKGYNKTITLSMTTNGSTINPYIINLLKQFYKTQLIVSVDGVGHIGDYQRHGSIWSKVSENIATLGNLAQDIRKSSDGKWLGLAIHSVISAYTIMGVDTLMEYYVDLYHRFGYSINVTVINNPNLSLDALPNHLRSVAKNKLQRSMEILQPISHDFNIQQIINQFQQVEKILSQPLTDFARNQYFVEFTTLMDHARNQSFEKTFGLPLTVDR